MRKTGQRQEIKNYFQSVEKATTHDVWCWLTAKGFDVSSKTIAGEIGMLARHGDLSVVGKVKIKRKWCNEYAWPKDDMQSRLWLLRKPLSSADSWGLVL